MTTAMLLAYHGDPSLKQRVLSQLRAHREADELVHGRYWSNGKGCAVGCLTHDPSGGHSTYPDRWGIPVELAYLEDAIFEGQPLDEAQEWPARFMSAIRVGSDLSLVWPRFAELTLREDLLAIPAVRENASVATAIRQVADLYGREITGDRPTRAEWAAAEAEAEAEAWAAERAAVSGRAAEMVAEKEAALAAAQAARAAQAAGAAGTAAQAARTAAQAAWVAEKAARAAEKEAAQAAGAALARVAGTRAGAGEAALAPAPARAGTYRRMADRLVVLLKAATPMQAG